MGVTPLLKSFHCFIICFLRHCLSCLLLFVTSQCYLFRVSVVLLSVCYVIAPFSTSVVSSYVSYVTILSLHGFHRFITCLLRHCFVLGFDCCIFCLLRHYTIAQFGRRYKWQKCNPMENKVLPTQHLITAWLRPWIVRFIFTSHLHFHHIDCLISHLCYSYITWTLHLHHIDSTADPITPTTTEVLLY